MDGPFVAAAGNNEVVPTAAGNPVLLRAPSDGTYLLYFTNYRYYGKAMHTLALSLARSPSFKPLYEHCHFHSAGCLPFLNHGLNVQL